jgi:hypothetical protein
MKRALLLLLPAVLLAAGCAARHPAREGAAAAPQPAGPREQIVDLLAGSYFFTPPRIRVGAGAPAVIRVTDKATVISHDFVLEGPDGRVIVKRELSRGGVTDISLPPLPEGTYVFYCDKSFLGMSHRSKGMEGRLEVVPGAGTAQGPSGKP